MTFKSDKQPFCRWCGTRIRKSTNTIFFGREHTSWGRAFDAKPKSLAEAQRLVNEKIVSVQYNDRFLSKGLERDDPVDRYIDKATVWDGESYEDEFFCNGEHARLLGRAAARKGWSTGSWQKAHDKAKGGK